AGRALDGRAPLPVGERPYAWRPSLLRHRALKHGQNCDQRNQRTLWAE
ncbi:Protein of unknown function, partial [Gryllus bimaculatus]